MLDRVGKTYEEVTIDMLPDDVLLEIFDFCRMDSSRYGIAFRPGSWHSLVHVCQRWRCIVFASPSRLDLTLLCTYGTPVRKNLGYWPPLPIIVDYFTSWGRRGPASNYEDDIIAALEQPDRVRRLKLDVTNAQLAMVASVMQVPFPMLTDIWMSSNDRNVPVLPEAFLGGSAPQSLHQLYLEGVSFPALPTFLLSASNLVYLRLEDIPENGYISPEAMATGLAASIRLNSLWIWFKPRFERRYPSPPPSNRAVLPSLVTLNFHGFSEYLELLLARIDTPRLHSFKISYFNQLNFHVPNLSQFIDRAENFELARLRHARIRFNVNNAYIKLDCEEGEHRISRFTLRVVCKGLDWQVSHLARILGQSRVLVSNVGHLSIDEDDLQPGWQRDMDDADWLELLRPFTAVKMLHASEQLAKHIALALNDASEELLADVLPSLISLWLDDQQVTSVEQFLAVRGFSITFDN